MGTLKFLLGVEKARTMCCRAVCLGGFFVVCFLGHWVFLLVLGLPDGFSG
jgi:hypothetical protein